MIAILRYLPIIVVVAGALTGYYYVRALGNDITELSAKNTKLEQQLTTERQNTQLALRSVDRLRAAQEEFRQSLEEMRENQIKARSELERLDDIFSQHSFGNLAQRKPGLIEKRVNNGTADIIRLLECATGAERSDC